MPPKKGKKKGKGAKSGKTGKPDPGLATDREELLQKE